LSQYRLKCGLLASFHDLSKEDGNKMPSDKFEQWEKMDFHPCNLLWQSV